MKKIAIILALIALMGCVTGFGEAGGMRLFGAYEQDGNLNNGPEPIEWIVLDAYPDGSSLLISRLALECKGYHTESRAVTWEECSLRRWLNEDFYQGAFTSEEKEKILVAGLWNSRNFRHGTPGGNDTEDRVFLLSAEEAERYFSNDGARACYTDKYAMSRGLLTYNQTVNTPCWWWLRTPGDVKWHACYVRDSGAISDYGAVTAGYGVRPVIRVAP